MTIYACQADKDVYSEKPTGRTIQEGQAMINAARANKRVVQIGTQGRSNPNARAACQFIRNGQIGKMKHVEVWHENNWMGGWGEESLSGFTGSSRVVPGVGSCSRTRNCARTHA